MKPFVLRCLLPLLGVLSCVPAWSSVSVYASAGNATTERSESVGFPAGVDRAWSYGSVAGGKVTASVNSGSPPCPNVVCTDVGSLDAVAGAQIDSRTMRFSASAMAESTDSTFTNSWVGAYASDILLYDAPVDLIFNIHIDLALSARGADASVDYGFVITGACCGIDETEEFFSFRASENAASGRQIYWEGMGDDPVAFPSTRTVFDISYPLSFGYGTFFDFDVLSFARVRADDGVASVDAAVVTLSITGDYTSVNGYTYPGFTRSIPEPAGAALMLVGLCVVGAVRLARRSS